MATVIAENYAQAAQILETGDFALAPVTGNDMLPFFKPGCDSITIAPVRPVERKYSGHETALLKKHNSITGRRLKDCSAADGRMTIRRRDIVLVYHRDWDAPRLLRAVHVWGTLLLLRCDHGHTSYINATVSDVLGVVVEGTFGGGIRFTSTSRKWRFASKAWTAMYRVRLWLKASARPVRALSSRSRKQ